MPNLFDHVTLGASDVPASQRFYDTVLATLGVPRTDIGDEGFEWQDFGIAPARDGRGVSRNLHIAFAAPDRDHVDALHRAGVEAGYTDDGAPGPRTQYREDYYGAFLLDPDGNSIEAVHHADAPGRFIDHFWIRVVDVPAARDFYATIAPHAGFAMRREADDRVQFAATGGSFTLVSDGRPRTEHVHLAFAATDDAAVDAFHRAALEAGYTDNGAPGERPEYHPGYYGAYVLDPDGHNVEVVNHHRAD